ncbi:hypothetical protein SAMN04488505_105230 [Chitinophaga rupis]|uniref:Nucleotide-diphospho-sugar transferase n=1 Tax=Chitinophaga rupis TaxID=573321 RepID=A0A1H7ZWE8_9BACT|nr:nucleotide-diphospho-sugar transferase [Chitinophaga rupis]SEM62775.1 hypothetical protein SAMN04488505_105230 [Chitinophaga rupis]
MSSYKVQSAVLMLIFKRPDTTQQVFDQVKAVRPDRLYVAADGPREGHPTDAALCAQTRDIIKQVDWPCTVRTLFRDQNLGSMQAPASGITWFFEQEEEGIILEDDCLPNTSFFYFCDAMLEKYRHDTRMFVVTGTNSQDGQTWGPASYYFSRHSSIWGWASWRRVWQQYDVDLRAYKQEDVKPQLQKIFNDPFLVDIWVNIFETVQQHRVQAWDHQLQLITLFENGLCITPNVNLISNIGFREDATHTFSKDSHNANRPTQQLTNIIHPTYIMPETDADYYFMNREFDLASKWRRYNKPKRRFKRWVRSWLSGAGQ